MLSMSSNSPYQHKSIRSAIQDEEHHIVRVNEEGTGEVYDLNLSHSTPYASPVNTRSTTNSTEQANQATENGRRHLASSAGTSNGVNGHSNGDDRGQASSSTPSHGRRLLHLPHIVSRRYAASNANNNASNNAAAGPAAAPIEMKGLNNSKSKSDGVRNGNALPHLVGELPPSPPLEEDDSNGNIFDASVDRTQQEEPSRGRIDPRRSTRRDSMPSSFAPGGEDIRKTRSRNNIREGSGVSNASTAYHSATSHEGSEDDEKRVAPSRYSTALMTSEPDALLHPNSAQYFDNASSSSRSLLTRRASPASSQTSLNTSQTAMAKHPGAVRRNTTGDGSPGQRKRPGSVGSSGTQRSYRGSRERGDILPASGTFEEPLSMTDSNQASRGAPTVAPPLQTGNSKVDEDIANIYDQMRRQRETKKMRETNVDPEKQQQQQQQQAAGQTTSQKHKSQEGPMRSGTVLARVKSGRKPTEEEPKALIGNVIGEEHDNYVLMYNMLTGIRIGVSRCQAKAKRPLTDADYSARHKFTFDIVGNELNPSAKYDFKFKDYAPWVFRELREYFHLDPADYLLSLTAKYILSELGSPGKSGSFFYFSRDYRFIIKTIRHNEHKFLLRILRDYHMHIKLNPHTLLSRFYGLHRVKLPGGKKIHFVIMNNLFPPHRDIHETYDLKGSAIGREYPEEKAAQKKGAVLKDLNWIHRDRELQLGPEKKAMFEAQVNSDVALLQRLHIMDYSLLIGLHDMKRGNREGLRQDALQVVQPESSVSNNNTTTTAEGGTPHVNLKREPTTRKEQDAFALRAAVRRSDAKALNSTSTAKLPERETSDRRHFIFYQEEGGYRSSDENNIPTDYIYYFGIIDTLTLYSSVKRGEHYWKSITNNSKMISSIHPVPYGKRFCDFLFSVIKVSPSKGHS